MIEQQLTGAGADRLSWRISSYSGGGNDCVEIAVTWEGTAVRDSKDRAGGAFTVSPGAWRALLDAARTGALDPR